jgi:hypothetical protein
LSSAVSGKRHRNAGLRRQRIAHDNFRSLIDTGTKGEWRGFWFAGL